MKPEVIEPTCTICWPYVKCRVAWKGQGFRLTQFHDQPAQVREEYCEIKVMADNIRARKENIEDRQNDLLLGS